MHSLSDFERIARSASSLTEEPVLLDEAPHPFLDRDIHDKIPPVVRKLFDNSHYAQATFEAMKFLDKLVSRISKSNQSGFKLMMDAFSESNPKIKINSLATSSEIDEQKGFQFMVAGSTMAIRNPRGHEFDVQDSPETCLDHLTFVSMILRRLESAGLSF